MKNIAKFYSLIREIEENTLYKFNGVFKSMSGDDELIFKKEYSDDDKILITKDDFFYTNMTKTNLLIGFEELTLFIKLIKFLKEIN